MDYLNLVNDRFPVRRSQEQKNGFRAFVTEEASRLGHTVSMQTLQGKHTNIIIGDLLSARAVFTAHYDTPAASLVPNLMMPRNLPVLFLYQFGYPMLLALASMLLAFGVKNMFSLDNAGLLVSYLVLYLGIYFLCTRTFANQHNKNDNTSGVAVILSMLGGCHNPSVAYILFDNEEKGLLGSKACAKAHKELFADKLVVNMDCVGLGEHIITIGSEGALCTRAYDILKESLCGNGKFFVHHFPAKGSRANSDHKSFPKSVGIMACKKHPWLGFYTWGIHTAADRVAYPQNIGYLCEQLVNFAEQL